MCAQSFTVVDRQNICRATLLVWLKLANMDKIVLNVVRIIVCLNINSLTTTEETSFADKDHVI